MLAGSTAVTDVRTPNEPDPGGDELHVHEGLADYRADRDDFSRLLYLVFREIRGKRETDQKRSA
jgi:hypothetical protein